MQHALHPQEEEEGSEWVNSPFGYKSERSPQLLPSSGNLQVKWGQQMFTGWIMLKRLEHLLCLPWAGKWGEQPAAPWGTGVPRTHHQCLQGSTSRDTNPWSTEVWVSSGFTPCICPIPLLSPPGCSWTQQPWGSRATPAPSPWDKIKPPGYRDRKPLICHRKNAHGPKIWPLWAALNSNPTAGRAGTSSS